MNSSVKRVGPTMAVTVLISVLLPGCSSGPDLEVSEWQEPAWFAEQARAQEEVAAILQACMDAKGWDLTVGSHGDIEENLAELSDPEKAVGDVQSCFRDIPATHLINFDHVYVRETLYPQELDVYECLVIHGAEPNEPQSVDLFIEGYLGDNDSLKPWTAWTPELMNQYADEHGEAALEELERACPQPYTPPQL